MADFIAVTTHTAPKMVRAIRTVALAALLAPAGCAYWGAPIEGRVVDADSSEPLEGVAIAAVWETYGGLEGGVPQCPVAMDDAVTDAQGRYRIEGWGPRLPGGSIDISAPTLYYFKDGYHLEIGYTDRGGYRGNLSYHIDSDQDGKTIRLERYEGPPDEYVEAIRGLGQPKQRINGCECRWEKIPHYTAALVERQRKEYSYAFDTYIELLRGDGSSYQCSDPLKVLPLSWTE